MTRSGGCPRKGLKGANRKVRTHERDLEGLMKKTVEHFISVWGKLMVGETKKRAENQVEEEDVFV